MSLGHDNAFATLLFKIVALHRLQIVGLSLFPNCICRPLHRAVKLIELVLFRINFLTRIGKATVTEILVVVCLVAIRLRFARSVGYLLTPFYYWRDCRLHLGEIVLGLCVVSLNLFVIFQL